MKRVMFSTFLVFAIGAGITVVAAQMSEKDAAVVEREVREVFDKWSTALGRGDKKTYLDSFWNSPRLVIRVANGEWRGIDAYRKRIEAAQLPPASPSDYKNVEVVALGRDAAVVTYERSGRVTDLQGHGRLHSNCGRLEDRCVARAFDTGEELSSLNR